MSSLTGTLPLARLALRLDRVRLTVWVLGLAVMPMVLGGIVQWLWARQNAEQKETFCIPLASGFIAGEALLVLAFAIIAMLTLK